VNGDELGIFGLPGPSHEVISVCRALSPIRGSVRALDLGAGSGRNSLFLAAEGCRVTAVDSSSAEIRALREASVQIGLDIDCILADVRFAPIGGNFGIILLLGILHYLPAEEAIHLVREIQSHTEAGGVHVITRSEQPPAVEGGTEIRTNARGMRISDEELLELYRGWHRLAYEQYIKSDYHLGQGAHTLRLSKMVFRAPGPAQYEVIGIEHALADRRLDRQAEEIFAEASLMKVSCETLIERLGSPDQLVEHFVKLPRCGSGPQEGRLVHSLKLFLWANRIAYVENGLLVGTGRFISNAFHTYSCSADR
jgi:tellurite methyltransferase